MWVKCFSSSLNGRPFASRRHDQRRRSQKHNASSKSNAAKNIQQNSNVHKTTGGWWSQTTARISSAVAGIGASMQNSMPKNFDIPVKVDVDMIKPTLISIQTEIQKFWLSVPKPVRDVVPYVAVALFSGMFVRGIYAGAISRERAKNEELKQEVEMLQSDKKSRPLMFTHEGGAFVSSMTEALAQATNSAARAAEAAAVAAETCAIRSRRGIRPTQRPASPS